MYLRVLIQFWLTVWVLAAPVFHIHTLDVQENHFLSQVVLVHTVFSPDLPGEYTSRSTVRGNRLSEQPPTMSTHFLRYSKTEIQLFNENDLKQKPRLPVALLEWDPRLGQPPLSSMSQASFQHTTPLATLLTVSGPPRAPPSRSC